MSSINKSVNVERRTWDKEAFEARARSRAAAALAAGKNESTSTVAVPASAAASAARDDDDGGHAIASSYTIIKNELNLIKEKEEFLPAQQGRAGPMGSQRAFLKARSNKVDLESKMGSTEIIDPAAASATRSKIFLDGKIDIVKKEGGGGGAGTHSSGVSKCADGVGWHCRVCDCFLKDSLTYLDHINGRKHQRYLGYTMRVEKSTTAEVSGVLKSLAEKKQGEVVGTTNGANSGSRIGGDNALDFEDVVRKKDEEALRRKAERARRREERKRNELEEKIHSARSAIPLELVGEDHADEEEDRATPTGIGNSVEDFVEEEEEEVVEGIDPNIAAMMGFSDFSGRRKK